MKSYKGLFEKIVTKENLKNALNSAAKGKRDNPAVLKLLNNSDEALKTLREEIITGVYLPRQYFEFIICDPKFRKISCADFRDRIVHHAVCSIISPIIEKRFINCSFACRKNYGSHKAVIKAQSFAKKNLYCLKCDIRKFFQSVDCDLLESMLFKILADEKLKILLRKIIREPSNKVQGIPIGNLTSQWFANFYLDKLDHYIKEELMVKYYLRYMDDFLLFGENKEDLYRYLSEIHNFLMEKLKLEMKYSMVRIFPVSEGIPFLGMNIYKNIIRLSKQRKKRLLKLTSRREKEFQAGNINGIKMVNSIQSSIGMLNNFDIKIPLKSSIDL